MPLLPGAQVENFFESKKSGFVAAVQEYEGEKGAVPVCFMDKTAFILIDDNETPMGRNYIREAIKTSAKEKCPISELYEEEFIPLGDTFGVDENVAAYYGLDMDSAVDIANRLGDLSCYWVTIEEDM